MTDFRRLNNIGGWIAFAIATIVYFLTLEPTASWWDCGEYIATAYKLQVGHPPGAPLFQLLGRFASLFAFGNLENVAMMVNVLSALSSSFTILFLFWTISMLARKLYPKDTELNQGQIYTILGSALIGSLAFTFSDSFWFSAVEGEVYAMSSLFTAIVFWAMLRWELVADKRSGFRWILLIAYLVGLSIGVHLLNLLAIPAIAYIYYFKRYKADWKGIVVTGAISIFLLAFIMYVIIPGIVSLSSKFELFFVNSMGMPFNSGTIVYFIILIGLIVFGLRYSIKKKMPVLNTVILSFVFILIGYSSFFMLIIRSNANTPIDENSPEDAISLLSYLNREQYGSWPIFHGQYYNSPVVEYDDGNPIYVKDSNKGKYVMTDDRRNTIPVYDPEWTTIFPRMWSDQKPGHRQMYEQYGKIKGTPKRVTKADGTTEVRYKPTFGENLRFFFTYQVGHMYFRYFFWNFIGRQNDIESQGEIQHGNWLSGIGVWDKSRLGDQSNLPESMKNPAHNKFYALPLLLGLIGFFFHLNRSKQDTFIVFLLWFMTGMAIIIFLNQYPYQPRERDYAYAGSFYAFAIWMGLGVFAITNFLKKYLKNEKLAAIAVTAVTLILVPGIMASEGWDDHDRSGKYAARDFASNYLNSCAPHAILFTNGDNDTFPLWYVQEVEELRTDVRVVNYMLASGYWYIHQLLTKVYESDPLPMTLTAEQYEKGRNQYIPYIDRQIQGPVELKQAIEFIASDNAQTKVPLQSGTKINYIPAKKLRITVDKEAVLRSGTVPPEMADQIVDYIDFDIRQSALYKNDLMLLDFIATNNWERPIYFANPNAVSKVLNVDRYCHLEGIVYRFLPIESKSYVPGLGGVNADVTYDVLMNKAKWGKLNEPDVTVDRESSRNSGIAKQNYLRLATALVEEQKKDSAVAVLDKCMEFFPHEKFTYDNFMLPYVDVYYSAGASEKANEIMRTLAERYEDDLDYYFSLEPSKMMYYDEDIQMAMAIIQRLGQVAKRNQQQELGAEMDSLFMEKIDLYQLGQ